MIVHITPFVTILEHVWQQLDLKFYPDIIKRI